MGSPAQSDTSTLAFCGLCRRAFPLESLDAVDQGDASVRVCTECLGYAPGPDRELIDGAIGIWLDSLDADRTLDQSLPWDQDVDLAPERPLPHRGGGK